MNQLVLSLALVDRIHLIQHIASHSVVNLVLFQKLKLRTEKIVTSKAPQTSLDSSHPLYEEVGIQILPASLNMTVMYQS
jgi:hypothetical protein